MMNTLRYRPHRHPGSRAGHWSGLRLIARDRLRRHSGPVFVRPQRHRHLVRRVLAVPRRQRYRKLGQNSDANRRTTKVTRKQVSAAAKSPLSQHFSLPRILSSYPRLCTRWRHSQFLDRQRRLPNCPGSRSNPSTLTRPRRCGGATRRKSDVSMSFFLIGNSKMRICCHLSSGVRWRRPR